MNRKQLILLLVIVVALGAAGWWLYQGNQSAWKGGTQGTANKVLGDLPVNDVAQIVIKSDTNELDLVKKDNLWRVKQRDDYRGQLLRDQRIPPESRRPQGRPNRGSRPFPAGPLQAAPARHGVECGYPGSVQ